MWVIFEGSLSGSVKSSFTFNFLLCFQITMLFEVQYLPVFEPDFSKWSLSLSMCGCGECYTSAIYKSCFVPKVTWLRMYVTVFLFWMLVNHTLMVTGKLRWKLCSQNLKKKYTSVINNYRLNAVLMRPCLSKFWWRISVSVFFLWYPDLNLFYSSDILCLQTF